MTVKRPGCHEIRTRCGEFHANRQMVFGESSPAECSRRALRHPPAASFWRALRYRSESQEAFARPPGRHDRDTSPPCQPPTNLVILSVAQRSEESILKPPFASPPFASPTPAFPRSGPLLSPRQTLPQRGTTPIYFLPEGLALQKVFG